MKSGEIRKLPLALRESSLFNHLAFELHQEMEGRVARIDQICASAEASLMEAGEDVFDLLDDLECDAMVLGGATSNPEVDNWVVHSTWILEFDRKLLTASLSAQTLQAIERYPPPYSSGKASFRKWTKLQVEALRAVIEEFYEAETAEAALANKICIDIILGLFAVSGMVSRFATNR